MKSLSDSNFDASLLWLLNADTLPTDSRSSSDTVLLTELEQMLLQLETGSDGESTTDGNSHALEAELRAAEAKTDALEAQLQAAQQQIPDLNDQLLQERHDHAHELKALRQEQLVRQENATSDKHDADDNLGNDQAAEIVRLKEQLRASEEASDELEAKLSELATEVAATQRMRQNSPPPARQEKPAAVVKAELKAEVELEWRDRVRQLEEAMDREREALQQQIAESSVQIVESNRLLCSVQTADKTAELNDEIERLSALVAALELEREQMAAQVPLTHTVLRSTTVLSLAALSLNLPYVLCSVC